MFVHLRLRVVDGPHRMSDVLCPCEEAPLIHVVLGNPKIMEIVYDPSLLPPYQMLLV